MRPVVAQLMRPQTTQRGGRYCYTPPLSVPYLRLRCREQTSHRCADRSAQRRDGGRRRTSDETLLTASRPSVGVVTALSVSTNLIAQDAWGPSVETHHSNV